MRPVHRNRETNGLFQDNGQGDPWGESKHTILLLHGLMGTSERDFGFILPALSKDFNVIKIRFQGFGRVQNDLVIQPTVDDIVRDLVGIIERKQLVMPYIFGYCFGGHIALRLALDHPDYTRGVFCYGTKVFWDKEDAENSKTIYDLNRIRYQNISWHSRLQEDHGVNLDRVSNISKSLSDEMVGYFDGDLDKLRDIRTEFVFIYGDNDDLATVNEALIIEGINRRFSCYVIPGAGHNMFHTNPTRVVAILTAHVFGCS